jgi:transcriptional regulator with XRE-family HTH domain
MLNIIKIKLMQMKKSQRSLARKLRISETYLSETICQRRIASPKLRRRIAAAIGADENEIFGVPVHISDLAPQVIGSEAASQ